MPLHGRATSEDYSARRVATAARAIFRSNNPCATVFRSTCTFAFDLSFRTRESKRLAWWSRDFAVKVSKVRRRAIRNDRFAHNG
jgi:hypothetical protein